MTRNIERVQASIPDDERFASGITRLESPRNLDGYILHRSPSAPGGWVMSWNVRLVEIYVYGGSPSKGDDPSRQRYRGAHVGLLHLHPIARLMMSAARSNPALDPRVIPSEERTKGSKTQQQTARAVIFRPVVSGQSYRITSPPVRGLVRIELAEALESVFERFARQQGFSGKEPLEISLSRGYKANSHGHREGRAADIDAVGGKNLLQWKEEWERAVKHQDRPAETIAARPGRNLGYMLYKALQSDGGWRVNPGGWRVYQNVMQLFGPWTATEGPWKAMQIEKPNPEERQRLADQRWVFQAHQDHIHVAL